MNIAYLVHLANYSDGILYVLMALLLIELAVMVDRFWYLRRTLARGDAIGFLRQRAPLSADLVLLDPPFGADALFEPALAATHACLADDGLAYLEAPRQWSGEELAALGFAVHRHMKAGAVHAHLLRKLESES